MKPMKQWSKRRSFSGPRAIVPGGPGGPAASGDDRGRIWANRTRAGGRAGAVRRWSQGLSSGRPVAALAVFLLSLLAGCRPDRGSFDQIQYLVQGRTAQEVASLLGKPDREEKTVLGDQRWTWWYYTYLDGASYAPEVRGQVVHLEIVFEKPDSGGDQVPAAQWRVGDPLCVSYELPAVPRPAGGWGSPLLGQGQTAGLMAASPVERRSG